jgi:hypothetical protein
VPRSIDLTAQSPYSVADIRSAFDDEAYWSYRLAAFEGGSPTLDHLTVDASGQTSVSMTMRFSGDQLPEPIRLLRLPALEIVQSERWHAIDGGTLRGEIAVDAPRTPMSGRGSVHLAPDGSGTQLAGTATVKVNVPIVGGPISRFIAGVLARGIVDIVHATDAWLADGPKRTARPN